jgi:hypothetical protein
MALECVVSNLNFSASSWLFILLFIIQDARSNEIKISNVCKEDKLLVHISINRHDINYIKITHILSSFLLLGSKCRES